MSTHVAEWEAFEGVQRGETKIMFSGKLKHAIKTRLYPDFRREFRAQQIRERAEYQLKTMPRYQRGSSELRGKRIEFCDAASFAAMREEIFKGGIYRFRAESQTPFIIDGGANIGLSALYFKELYPDCRILAFEPDPDICAVLRTNLEMWQARDVEVINKALWSSQTTLEFQAEGADAGRVVSGEDSTGEDSTNEFAGASRVETVRLRDYLDRPVDFLKLDIEGAETEVVLDCAQSLGNVANLFVEYHSFAGRKQTLPDLLHAVREAGLRVHIHAPVQAPQPLFERATYHGMDMQLNIFAWRD